MKLRLGTATTGGIRYSAGSGDVYRRSFLINGSSSPIAGRYACAGLAGLESPRSGGSLSAQHGSDRIAPGSRTMAVTHPPWEASIMN